MRFSWKFTCICGLAAALAGPAVAEEPAAWMSRLAEAVARAEAKNPALLDMEARIEAARHRVPQASALPDPEIELALKDVPTSDFSLSRDDFTMATVAGKQTFPGAGKRPARRRAAEAEVVALEAMHVWHQREVAAETAIAFFDVAELDARRAILEQSRERLKRAAASAAERYRVGRGAQADVLRANVEVTAVEERLASLTAERRRAAARLNALQALPAGSEVAPVDLPEQEPSAPTDLSGRAEGQSPALAAARAELSRAEEEVKLAGLEARPDWTATTYYARRQKFDDLVGASIAFNLPFVQGRRLKERRAEKEAELSGARARLEQVRNELSRALEEGSAELTRNLAQARLYRDSILPQAETNFLAAQEAYAVGQIDFLTFIRAALDRDAYEGEWRMRRAGSWRALAMLEKASGLPLLPLASGGEHAKN